MSPAATPQAARQPAAPRITTDQKRAQWAWDQVRSGADKDYVGLVKAAPTLIMGSGLLQALAFLSAKSKHSKAHAGLLGALLRVLGLPDAAPQAIPALVAKGSAEYRRLTEEALAHLRWLRHFADVMQSGD